MIDAQTLIQAAESGDTHTVKALLDQGADVDAKLASGETALMRAASNGHLQIVEILLEHGADVNAKRGDGMTALIRAAFFGHSDVVRALVEHRADVHAQDRLGSTAIRWASSKGYPDIVQILKNPQPAPAKAPVVSQAAAPIIAPLVVNEPVQPASSPADIQPFIAPVAAHAPPPPPVNWHTEADEAANTHESNSDLLSVLPLNEDDRRELIVESNIVPPSVTIANPTSPPTRELTVESNTVPPAFSLPAAVPDIEAGNFIPFSGKSLWRIGIAALIISFVSGAAVYTLTKDMRRPPTDSHVQSVVKEPVVKEPVAQPVRPTTPPPSAQNKQNSQSKIQQANTTIARPAAATSNTNSTSERKASRNVALVQPSESASAQRNKAPRKKDLTQQDNIRRDQPQGEVVSLPSNKSENNVKEVVPPQAAPTQDAVSNELRPSITPSANPSSSPKKKVIRWP